MTVYLQRNRKEHVHLYQQILHGNEYPKSADTTTRGWCSYLVLLPEHWGSFAVMLGQKRSSCPQVRSCVSFSSYHPIKQHFSEACCVLSVGRRLFETPSLLGRPSLRHTFIHHFVWHTDTPPPHLLWLCVFGWADPAVQSM